MKPGESDLRALYVGERLTTRAIAERFDVSHMTVKRWLRAYNIERRPPGRGLANRGLLTPTRAELVRLVEVEHQSYRDIAARFGVDFTAVTYWLNKYAIARPTVWETRRKGKVPIPPTFDQIRAAYSAGQSLAAIGQQFGVSAAQVTKLCREYRITTRMAGWKTGPRIECSDGHAVRSTYEHRVDEWLHLHGLEHSYEPQLTFDRRSHADFFTNGWMIEIWGVQNSARYTARRRRKLAAYRAHGVPLIEIPVHAFDTAHKGLWERRLQHVLTAPVS